MRILILILFLPFIMFSQFGKKVILYQPTNLQFQQKIFGEIDGKDGVDMIVLRQNHPVKIELYKNTGTGYEHNAVLIKEADSSCFQQPLLLDLNNDGWLDLVVRQDTVSYYSEYSFTRTYFDRLYFLNDGKGNLIETDLNIGAIYDNKQFVDVDGDGDIDILKRTNLWKENKGKFKLRERKIFEERKESLPRNINLHIDPVFADIDNDKDLDFIAFYEDGKVRRGSTFAKKYILAWHEQLNKGNFNRIPSKIATIVIVSQHENVVKFGDINGDSFADILITDDDGLRVFANQEGNGFKQYAYFDDFSVYQDYTLIDINDDNDLDILFKTKVGCGTRIGMYENKGNKFDSSIQIVLDNDYSDIPFASDVNNDGFIDLVDNPSVTKIDGFSAFGYPSSVVV